MKIVLDLSKSINNYDWKSDEELKNFIEEEIKPKLWDLYDSELLVDEEQNRLYDLLDMFNNYEIIEKESE